MGYAHIEVRRCIGALGAEVSGVDLSKPLEKPVADEIHAAWLEHQALFFRGQDLSPAQQAAFAAHFGELDVYPFVRALDAHPNVIPIIKEPHTRMNFGGGWHTDTSYLPKPPKATLLYAVEVPEEVRPLREVLREAEARHLARALELTGGHRSQAAELLGISRKVLWEKLRDHGLAQGADAAHDPSEAPGKGPAEGGGAP